MHKNNEIEDQGNLEKQECCSQAEVDCSYEDQAAELEYHYEEIRMREIAFVESLYADGMRILEHCPIALGSLRNLTSDLVHAIEHELDGRKPGGYLERTLLEVREELDGLEKWVEKWRKRPEGSFPA